MSKLGYKRENWLEQSSERSSNLIKNFEASLLASEKMTKHRGVFSLSRVKDRKIKQMNYSKTTNTEAAFDEEDDSRDKYYLNPFDMRNYCLNKIINKMDARKIEQLNSPSQLGRSNTTWNRVTIETPNSMTRKINFTPISKKNNGDVEGSKKSIFFKF